MSTVHTALTTVLCDKGGSDGLCVTSEKAGGGGKAGLRIWIRIRMDRHCFWKLDPNPDPYLCENLDPGALKAQNRIVEGRRLSNGGEETQNWSPGGSVDLRFASL